MVPKISTIPLDKTPDDLKKINGIGPVLESKLNELGIYTYEQITLLTDADLDRIAEVTTFGKSKIIADDWIGQAKELQQAKLF
jgi:predicted flap endonuclease-1-like 5' DNA nuclease